MCRKTMSIIVIFLVFAFSCKAQKIVSLAKTFGEKNNSTSKILVTYASKYGSTAGVAEAIGKELANCGALVDVMPVQEIINIDSYKAVVIGSGIYKGKWSKNAVGFIKKNRKILSTRPVALFQVCMSLTSKDTSIQKLPITFFKPIFEIVKPVDYTSFAGKLDYSKLDFITRYIIKRKYHTAEGDFRNWDAIRQWSKDLYGKLIK